MNEVVRTPWAEAVDNGDFICVDTYSGYRSGVRDPLGKQHLLPPDVGDLELGAAVLDCFAHSRFVTPQEDMALYDYEQVTSRYAEWVKNLMATYGYKTKRALFKRMKRCGIESLEGFITIDPTYHEKLEAWGGNGISKEDCIVIPADSTPSEVGSALRLALSRCT